MSLHFLLFPTAVVLDILVSAHNSDVQCSVLPLVYGRRLCLHCCWSQNVEQLT